MQLKQKLALQINGGVHIMKYIKAVLFVLLAGFTLITSASEWLIDNDHSQLNFISTKKVNIAEVHQFTELRGGLDASGQFSVNINLASVDTHISIRDSRMAEFLFEIESYATATLSANIDLEALDAIPLGASSRMSVGATLELHGESKALELDVIITRLIGGQLSVVSAQPVILNTADFSLVAGVDKLREIAKLPSISQAVPVSFYLILNLKR